MTTGKRDETKEFGGGGNGTSPASPSPSVHGALGKLKIRCIGKGNYEGALGGKRKKTCSLTSAWVGIKKQVTWKGLLGS